jgi:hypothetical protein
MTDTTYTGTVTDAVGMTASAPVVLTTTAVTGTPQLPTLFAGYPRRPPWQVAGVDFYVGHPATATKNPSSISMTGVSVDNSAHWVNITGANVVLDGYDFSLSGGWRVQITGANATIKNSKFIVGSNGNIPLYMRDGGSSPTIDTCTIDGGANSAVGGLVIQNVAGLTVKNCWLKNCWSDCIQIGGGGNLVVTGNVFQENGKGNGHADLLQVLFGPYSNITITNNTTYQPQGWTQGLMVEPDVGTTKGSITKGDFGFNTMVAHQPTNNDFAQNFLMGITTADVVQTFPVHDNYFDPTGTLGMSRNGPTTKCPYTNNINIKT